MSFQKALYPQAKNTEYFEKGLCIIEWGKIIKDILPDNTIYITIEHLESNENHRKITIIIYIFLIIY